MKILFIKSAIHHKNLNFILNCKQIQFYIIDNVNEIKNINLSDYDAVYSPCDIIDIPIYPNTKFVFGPHFSVFPDDKINIIKGKNSIYIQPSEWVANYWKRFPLCNNLNISSMPFGVETDKFNEIKSIYERKYVFIYYKSRHPTELEIIKRFLNSNSIEYIIFDYKKKYNENDYIQYLQNSIFGIWLGCHESQGFALEEALSCNVPLLVWSVKSMNQEYGYNYQYIPATSIPYWDERCGAVFYNADDLNDTFKTFISKLYSYKPREYIIENLSIDVCEQKFISLINNM